MDAGAGGWCLVVPSPVLVDCGTIDLDQRKRRPRLIYEAGLLAIRREVKQHSFCSFLFLRWSRRHVQYGYCSNIKTGAYPMSMLRWHSFLFWTRSRSRVYPRLHNNLRGGAFHHSAIQTLSKYFALTKLPASCCSGTTDLDLWVFDFDIRIGIIALGSRLLVLVSRFWRPVSTV